MNDSNAIFTKMFSNQNILHPFPIQKQSPASLAEKTILGNTDCSHICKIKESHDMLIFGPDKHFPLQ